MAIGQADIREYLDRIAASNVLGRGERRPALLEYLLMTEAADEGDKIKAYSIGLDVFGKPADFDPTTDSSVRVEVGRLRTAIALFESSDMADTVIKVDIPVGTYRPEITLRSGAALPDSPVADAGPAPATSSDAISAPLATMLGLAVFVLVGVGYLLLVRDPAGSSGPPISLMVEDFGGDAIGQELSILVQDSFQNNSVVKLLDAAPGRTSEGDYVVRGNVTEQTDFLRVSAELANLGTRQVVWSHVFEIDNGARLGPEIDAKLNGELETRLIGAAKVLLEQREVTSLTPEQLFILGTWVSGPAISSLEWETERVTLMRLALDKDPDFGPAHSVLADKYGFLANMHPDWDTEENLALSRFHAERASELSPLDSSALFNVAQSYWHAGRHADSQRIFRRVTELDSSNSLARFFARVVPYWCGEVPDDVMAWALAFDASLSSDDPIRWIVLTWIATLHTNRQDYGLALQAATDAAQIFEVGYTYMAHAMLLTKADQHEAAQAVFSQQLPNWPGIDAAHYAGSTIPRLCREQADPDRFIADYEELSAALTTASAQN